jgi:hypothetical protein
MSFRETQGADTGDSGPAPGTRQPLPWSVLRITRARDRRKQEKDGAVFLVVSGELPDRRPVEIFLTLADPAAVERGVALANALLDAGGVNGSGKPRGRAPLLFAFVQQLNVLPPVEVSGALIERHGSFIPRIEIDSVRPAQTKTFVEEPT